MKAIGSLLGRGRNSAGRHIEKLIDGGANSSVIRGIGNRVFEEYRARFNERWVEVDDSRTEI